MQIQLGLKFTLFADSFFRPVTLRQHLRETITLAIPVMLSQLGHIMVGVFDSLMVGRLGSLPLAAASLANSVFTVVLVFGLGLSFGITPLVASANGSRNRLRIGLLLGNGLLLCTAAGLLMAALMHAMGALLPLLNQPREVVSLAIPYFRILAWSVLPLMVFQGFRQFLEGVSQTRQAMLVSLGCNACNILLNYLLIYGHAGFPAMGMKGAAVSTLISRVLMAVAMGYFLWLSKWGRAYWNLASWGKASWPHVWHIARIGLPSGVQFVLEVSAFSVSAIMIGWLGARSLAAHQVAITTAAVTYMMASGISAAATIRVGNFRGAGKLSSLKQAGRSALLLVLVFMAINAALFIVFRNQLPLLFIKEEAVLRVAGGLMVVAGLFQISDGLQVVSLGALRGLEDVKVPTVITLIAYWVIALPLGYMLGFWLHWGAQGVWMGLWAGLSVAALLLMLRFQTLSRRHLRHEQAEAAVIQA